MRILLAIDSSALSEVVLSEVESRPWPPGTEACVLTVIDLFALTASVGYLEPFVKSENEAAKAFVHSAAERLSRRGLQTTAQAVEGYPGTAIVEEAEKWDADFVFVGSHGHSGFVRFLIGSIAKAVVQNAPCSVDIIRNPRHAKQPPEHDSVSDTGIKILLASDGSAYSLAAARSVAERSWPEDTQVRIVSVVEQILPAADPWYLAGAVADQVREQNVKVSEEAVDTAKEIIARAGLKTETAVLEGAPKRCIADDAKEWGARLIVVGSHGRRGVLRFLLGSVSEAVAMHAHCSVEVIRDRSLLGGEQV